MVIDARERFAERVAQWMVKATHLSASDMQERLSRFEDREFLRMIAMKSREYLLGDK